MDDAAPGGQAMDGPAVARRIRAAHMSTIWDFIDI
jgi:hypothetical protein